MRWAENWRLYLTPGDGLLISLLEEFLSKSVSVINDISLCSARHLLSSQKGNYLFRPGNNISYCLSSRARKGAKRRRERDTGGGCLSLGWWLPATPSNPKQLPSPGEKWLERLDWVGHEWGEGEDEILRNRQRTWGPISGPLLDRANTSPFTQGVPLGTKPLPRCRDLQGTTPSLCLGVPPFFLKKRFILFVLAT